MEITGLFRDTVNFVHLETMKELLEGKSLSEIRDRKLIQCGSVGSVLNLIDTKTLTERQLNLAVSIIQYNISKILIPIFRNYLNMEEIDTDAHVFKVEAETVIEFSEGKKEYLLYPKISMGVYEDETYTNSKYEYITVINLSKTIWNNDKLLQNELNIMIEGLATTYRDFATDILN